MTGKMSRLPALAVGDTVELTDPPARVPPLKVGQRGQVTVIGDYWGLVSVRWENGRCTQLHTGRLRRLDGPDGGAA